ncbi:c-type cytochrome [Uliginosibacterium gangwonense]|uniref:c-type cytochrome n=1 Tax=Uliginosibacterium gangwonense TaxID=392736 RepID=UPI0003A1D6E0|nr:c-type cytochrome [Uliginosibacterium gangwonense]
MLLLTAWGLNALSPIFASTVSHPLTDGKAYSAVLAQGQNGAYSFAGSIGQRLGLGLSNLSTTPSGGNVSVQVIGPDNNTVLANCGTFYHSNSGGRCNLPVFPANGTYTVHVQPATGYTASFNVILSSDVAKLITLSVKTAIMGYRSTDDLLHARMIAETICAGCHGQEGSGAVSTIPKIAGQNRTYIYKQLHDIKAQNGQPPARVVAPMLPFLVSLSDSDFKALAGYYSEKILIPEKSKLLQTFDLGQRIWQAGDKDRNIPACAGCHGLNGQGRAPLRPRLQGQFADYIANTLNAFKTDSRTNDLSGAMQAITKRMTQDEIESVAGYVAGLY